ncbi:MAG: hypothetical protein ACKVKX_07850, partial [Pseudomonadales bacterium]
MSIKNDALEQSSIDRCLTQNHLEKRWQTLQGDDGLFTLGETEFGYGAHFLAACDLWLKTTSKPSRLQFISASAQPPNKADLETALADWPQYADLASQLIDQYPASVKGMHYLELFDGRVSLCLMIGEADAMFAEIAQSPDLGLASHNT